MEESRNQRRGPDEVACRHKNRVVSALFCSLNVGREKVSAASPAKATGAGSNIAVKIVYR
jgi:hypothetical protein